MTAHVMTLHALGCAQLLLGKDWPQTGETSRRYGANTGPISNCS